MSARGLRISVSKCRRSSSAEAASRSACARSCASSAALRSVSLAFLGEFGGSFLGLGTQLRGLQRELLGLGTFTRGGRQALLGLDLGLDARDVGSVHVDDGRPHALQVDHGRRYTGRRCSAQRRALVRCAAQRVRKQRVGNGGLSATSRKRAAFFNLSKSLLTSAILVALRC